MLTRPDGKLETIQRPEESVTTFRTAPVSRCVTVTCALGITAPAESTMVPPNCPGSSDTNSSLRTKYSPSNQLISLSAVTPSQRICCPLHLSMFPEPKAKSTDSQVSISSVNSSSCRCFPDSWVEPSLTQPER